MATLDPVASRLGGIETRLDKLETDMAGLQKDMAGLRGEWRVAKWLLTVFVAPTCVTLIAGTFYIILSGA